MLREHHPIWPLYDEMRTARLNKKVLELDIRRLARRILWIEIVIGVTTSSSIGGLWFLQAVWVAWLWKGLGVVAVFMMVLKPILKYQEEKEGNEALLVAYGLFEDQLAAIGREVQTRQAYDTELKARFCRTMETKQTLIESAQGSRVPRKELERLEDQVEQAMPAARFYLPPV